MKSVYKIPQKIKCLTDERKRKSIPLFNIVMPVLLFLMLQYESFHTIFSAPEIRSIHEEMIDIIKRNRVFREGTIGGKRLIERLKKRHGHFADVIVADALYLNAPFINTLKENGLEGCPYKLRVVWYHEQWEENGKERERFM